MGLLPRKTHRNTYTCTHMCTQYLYPNQGSVNELKCSLELLRVFRVGLIHRMAWMGLTSDNLLYTSSRISGSLDSSYLPRCELQGPGDLALAFRAGLLIRALKKGICHLLAVAKFGK